jgi:hypothetical protein
LKAKLAEQLLATVMGWKPENVASERPMLQAMAAFKYDSYQQFSPGLRFIESLALWLNQFDHDERAVAYDFIKSSLVFCSAEEMDHFVEIAYQDYVRPMLLLKEADEKGLNSRHVGQVASSEGFRLRQRQTLFLGLSDGARIDSFRRCNPELNHEQIWQTHELADDRVTALLEKLCHHASHIIGDEVTDLRFRSIVLLDDFSASGSSYYATKEDGTSTGKVAKFLKSLGDTSGKLNAICHPDGVDVIILIYMATDRAIEHLRNALGGRSFAGVKTIVVETVQPVPDWLKMPRGSTEPFAKLIEKYYDNEIFDVHMEKGGTTDGKYGYADCGLPVVLHHNTPNNSVAILWFYERCRQRGLFPRVQRHREMS